MSEMSRSVTPARRRRSEESDEEESAPENGSTRSTMSKRARLDEQLSDGERSEVRPQDYRRSPQNGRHARNVSIGHRATQSGSREHQPGSIVRVSLTNFVTYTNAEFHPGPNLNMIIGPNGTGKSTLVCAICLGLGWATSHLGRAKEIGEFVKHGAKRAEIQIELAADSTRHNENPVITTRIIKEGNKSEYFIDDKKSNRKGVQAFARTFSIQVDNLCQFLPQDRVVEFAALSPVDLLTQTQRAAAPEYMMEWHDELKTKRKEQKTQQDEQNHLSDTLKNMENRQRLQEADVIRLRERAQLQDRMNTLEKMRPFSKYLEAKNANDEAKHDYKKADKELRRLQHNLEPNLRAIKDKKTYYEGVEKVVKQRRNVVQRAEGFVSDSQKKVSATQDKIQECLNEIESEKQSVRETKLSIPRHQQSINRLNKAIETPPPDYDFSEMNERIREKTRQIREVESRRPEIQDGLRALEIQLKQRRELISARERERGNLQSQAGQQASKLKKLSLHSAQAWEWIQKNRDQFQGPVYGPPVVECSVKDQRYANAVESMIPRSEMTAITVTNRSDFSLLQKQLYGAMKLNDINLRTSTQALDSFQPTVPVEQLPQLGLETYILNLIDGPAPVLAMLCDNRSIHQAAYTSHNISEAQFEAIKRTNIGSWIDSKQAYIISRRRDYGDQATSTRVNAIRQAQIFTDVPVDRQVEEDIDAQIREAKGEIEEITIQARELNKENGPLDEKKTKLMEEKKALEDDKNEKQRQLAEFEGLPVKRDKVQRQLEEAQAKIVAFKESRRAIEECQDTLCLEKGQQAIDCANSAESLRSQHIQLLEAEILLIEALSDFEQLETQHLEEQRLLTEKQLQVNTIRIRKEELHTKAIELADQCREVAASFGHEEDTLYQETMNWLPDQLETEIQSTQARLEMTLGGGNDNTLREFEKRAKSIEEKRSKLVEVDKQLENLQSEVVKLRERWEPELDALIGKISEAFAENFARIQCAGEVTVHKDEDFENWAIQVKVKFRETEALSVLDSHRQSGGERAVSTIFYLMALQSLARAPFRVVDEINQGMDPRNERMVHSRMVDIACAEHTSQYFLITPKLLQGLKYHPNMKVHCIASGEHMPSDHKHLDFAMLAQKALSLRQAGSASAAA